MKLKTKRYKMHETQNQTLQNTWNSKPFVLEYKELKPIVLEYMELKPIVLEYMELKTNRYRIHGT